MATFSPQYYLFYDHLVDLVAMDTYSITNKKNEGYTIHVPNVGCVINRHQNLIIVCLIVTINCSLLTLATK